MDVELKEEHEDGSATYMFAMDDDERKAMFIVGLQALIGDKYMVVTADVGIASDSSVNISDELAECIIEDGILRAIKASVGL